jgi:hypothetical protein
VYGLSFIIIARVAIGALAQQVLYTLIRIGLARMMERRPAVLVLSIEVYQTIVDQHSAVPYISVSACYHLQISTVGRVYDYIKEKRKTDAVTVNIVLIKNIRHHRPNPNVG